VLGGERGCVLGSEGKRGNDDVTENIPSSSSERENVFLRWLPSEGIFCQREKISDGARSRNPHEKSIVQQSKKTQKEKLGYAGSRESRRGRQ